MAFHCSAGDRLGGLSSYSHGSALILDESPAHDVWGSGTPPVKKTVLDKIPLCPSVSRAEQTRKDGRRVHRQMQWIRRLVTRKKLHATEPQASGEKKTGTAPHSRCPRKTRHLTGGVTGYRGRPVIKHHQRVWD